MSDVTLDCTCKEGFLAGDWFCSRWFQQTEKAHLCYYLICKHEPWAPKLAQLHPGGNSPLNTGISPLIPHEFILIFWYFMNQERDYSSSSKVLFSWWQQSGPLDPGDHIIPPFNSCHCQWELTENRVKHFQESSQPFLHAADVSPHPEAFSAQHPLLYMSQWSWADGWCPGAVGRRPLLLCAVPRAAWHLLKYL